MAAQVQTKYGIVEGHDHAEGVIGFKGLRYAAPPVGDLRWAPPAEPEAFDGVFKADDFGPVSIQPTAPSNFVKIICDAYGVPMMERARDKMGEDCLFLNVFTESTDEAAKRPVMVWIHGGGYTAGASNDYDPQHLVRKGMVVVTINYRLGVLGFLSHPELSAASGYGASGNYAIMDMQAALRWVQDNIAGFGGDPDCVTIFGESAGGMAVSQLMSSPLSKGLFHRAIAQSGIGLHQTASMTDKGAARLTGHETGLAVQETLGAKSLAEMRAISGEEVIKAVAPTGMAASCVIDGHVLPETPGNALALGIGPDVPFMAGSNAYEGSALFWGQPMVDAPMALNHERYVRSIETAFGDQAGKAFALYPAGDDDQTALRSAKEMLGDSLFGAQHTYVARRRHEEGLQSWLYYFTQQPPGQAGDILGAYHAHEIAYVFGVGNLGPVDNRDLSGTMMDAWIRFATTGDPNGGDLPDWPTYDPASDQNMVFGPEVMMGPVARREKYNLFEDRFARWDADNSAAAAAE